MKAVINNFSEQLAFEPEVINKRTLKKRKRFVVVGMGGSHLAADLLKISHPELELVIHNGYGLPDLPERDLKKSLIILSSYSGNTEEVLDAGAMAIHKGYACAAVTTGGKLQTLADAEQLPYVVVPKGLQPRFATGYMFKAILKLIGDEEAIDRLSQLAASFRPSMYEAPGKELAAKIKAKIPVIYSSLRNAPLAANWRVRFNETAKTPAFSNVVPEANHNEMIGFAESEPEHKDAFFFIVLLDEHDDPRIIKRFHALKALYAERGLLVEVVTIDGGSIFEKIFASIMLADWASYYCAAARGVDPEAVAVIEEFKRKIA